MSTNFILQELILFVSDRLQSELINKYWNKIGKTKELRLLVSFQIDTFSEPLAERCYATGASALRRRMHNQYAGQVYSPSGA